MQTWLRIAALVTTALVALPTPSLADRAHDLAKYASTVTVEQCGAKITDFRVCHLKFPTGCTNGGSYDAYLNYLKNQTPPPDLAVTRVLTVDDFQRLEGRLPVLDTKRHAAYARELAELGEGNIAAVIGYLYGMKVESKGKSEEGKGETSNCKLTRLPDVDYHIWIGFDARAAAKLKASARKAPSLSFKKTSIIVEMTPHYRARYHPAWTDALVRQYIGRQVKVVGQMLVDNDHMDRGADCAFPDHGSRCWRASVWELHPVIQFYVCTTSSSCAADSAKWVKIDDHPRVPK